MTLEIGMADVTPGAPLLETMGFFENPGRNASAPLLPLLYVGQQRATPSKLQRFSAANLECAEENRQKAQ
jgi:hypothetical protein